MKIRDGYREFHNSTLPEHADLFKQLESGQQPETLLVTCSDSRIDPAMITNAFGHLGDGNLHYNVFPPEGRSRERGRAF